MTSGITVGSALARARARGIDRLDARLLLARLLEREPTWVLAHDDAVLDGPRTSTWEGLCARRAAGEPLAYLLGEKEFHGLTLAVTRDVLVPRPETETLVDRAVEILSQRPAGARPRVVDLGTGSGAIALALKSACRDAVVCASDASPAALDVARANGQRLGLDVEWRGGSWWEPWGADRFDLALANPPYVAAADPHLPALAHEPVLALVSGADGLDALRAIVAGAPRHLVHGGRLWLEHGFDQAEAVRALLEAAGFVDVETLRDLAGQPRCSGGVAKAG